MPRAYVFAILWFLAGSAMAVPAQTGANAAGTHSDLRDDSRVDPRGVDASGYGRQIALGPEWLFAPDDDPAYASAAFDDSKWQTVSTERPLADYGYHGLRFAWYRIHIEHLPEDVDDLTIGTREMNGSYQIFANGVPIGSEGPVTGELERVQTRLETFAVPKGTTKPGGELVLAFRFVLNAAGYSGNGSSNPMSDDARVWLMSAESVAHETSYTAAHRHAVNLVLAGMGLIVGLVAIALYTAMRERKEYLAATVLLVAFSAASVVRVREDATAVTIAADWVQFAFLGAASVALIEFVRLVAGVQRKGWLLAVEAVAFVAAFGGPLARGGFGSVYVNAALFFLPSLAVDVLLFVVVIRAWKIRGNSEARRLLPALIFYSVAHFWSFGRFFAYFVHLTPRLTDMPAVKIGSYEVQLGTYGTYVFFLAILVFLVRRTFLVARDRASAAAEFEAAREVQQRLVPPAVAIPGFKIESAYIPAAEVGGDYFHIRRYADGSLLIVVGDVSGKGLPAALGVSAIIGALRALPELPPGLVLSALNRGLWGNVRGGFVTCCALHLTPTGAVRLANAGHLPPYRNGSEVETSNGFPLGLAEEAEYSETSLQLDSGDRMTLLTDGVVEARGKSGELLGFERTAKLSTEPAEEIARAAEKFGQNDDITVLTVACTA